MATVSIRSTTDISRTRNTVHKLLLAQQCKPNLAFRSVTAMNILSEALLRLDVVINLDIGVIYGSERKLVEMSCIPDLGCGKTTHFDEMKALLALVVNDVQIAQHGNCLSIYMRLW